MVPPVCILFGSQTGAARGVAEHIHTEGTRRGLAMTVGAANSYASAGFEASRLCVLVLATTGDGDAPVNAEEFVRFLRRRTHAKDFLTSMRVAVLGLGDTNYDKFCNCGKTVAKRLGELGAKFLLPPTYADESMGLDSAVDPFLAALWPALEAAGAGDAGPSAEGSGGGVGGGEAVSAAAGAGVAAPPAAVAPVHLAPIVAPTLPRIDEQGSAIIPQSPMAMMQAMKAVQAARTAAAGGRGGATAAGSGFSASAAIAFPAEALATPLRHTGDSTLFQASAAGMQPSSSRGANSDSLLEASAASEAAPAAFSIHAPASAQATTAPSPLPTLAGTAATASSLPRTHSYTKVPNLKQLPQGTTSPGLARSSSSPLLAAPPGSSAGAPPSSSPISAATPNFSQQQQLGLALLESPRSTPASSDSLGSQQSTPRKQRSALTPALLPSQPWGAPASTASPTPPPTLPTASLLTPGVLSLRQLFPELTPPPAAQTAGEKLFPQRLAPAALESLPLHACAAVLAQLPLPQDTSTSNPQTCIAQSPVLLPITQATLLGGPRQDPTRRVLALEFDFAGEGHAFAWGPGDVLGLYAPNDGAMVDALLARIGVNRAAALEAVCIVCKPSAIVPVVEGGSDESCSVGGGTSAAGAPAAATTQALLPALSHIVPSWLPGYPTPCLRDIFCWALDLTSQPKKTFLRYLGDCCSEEGDKDALYYLASRGGIEAFRTCVQDQWLTLLDLLALFPSCNPSPLGLIATLNALPPRLYSLTSSPLSTPTKLGIAFSVSEYTCLAGAGKQQQHSGAPRAAIHRKGIATPWLESITRHLWCASDSCAGEGGGAGGCQQQPPHPAVRVFLRAARNFSPPTSLTSPLIMVANGTGITPFMSFLAHREARVERARVALRSRLQGVWRLGLRVGEWGEEVEEEASFSSADSSLNPGPAVLVFGARHPEEDFFFKSALSRYASPASKALSALHMAWSRWENGGVSGKTYVQDVLGAGEGLGQGSSLVELLAARGGHMYICGKAAMVAGVRASVLKALAQFGEPYGVGSGAGCKHSPDSFLALLTSTGRLCVDLWG